MQARNLLEVPRHIDHQVGGAAGDVGLDGEAPHRIAGEREDGVVGAYLPEAEVNPRGGRVEAVGTEAQVARAAGRDDRQVDGEGERVARDAALAGQGEAALGAVSL